MKRQLDFDIPASFRASSSLQQNLHTFIPPRKTTDIIDTSLDNLHLLSSIDDITTTTSVTTSESSSIDDNTTTAPVSNSLSESTYTVDKPSTFCQFRFSLY
jgi:hypothetical protein